MMMMSYSCIVLNIKANGILTEMAADEQSYCGVLFY